jgi:hypothetical protein
MLDIENGNLQSIAVGVDSGSKREAFTVKSEKSTYLNILSDASTDVKDKVETRRNMRKARRFRRTPCRKNRLNRKRGCLPPSTKARWQMKLRIINILRGLYPITTYVVEDIKAASKEGKRKWNVSFSPLEVGKAWFYEKVSKLGKLVLKQGYDTAEMRKNLSLIKIEDKLEEVFEAHNVDSWVLAWSEVCGKPHPENKNILRMKELKFSRRQLHMLQPDKSGKRKRYGGTISLGLKKGSVISTVVKKKRILCRVGGNTNGRLSVHDLVDNRRLAQNVNVETVKFLCYSKWTTNRIGEAIPPLLKGRGLLVKSG